MSDKKQRRNCWLRISAGGKHAGDNQHCHRWATENYHGILVCPRHFSELKLVGPHPIMGWTYT
jgi:hypothetical protein